MHIVRILKRIRKNDNARSNLHNLGNIFELSVPVLYFYLVPAKIVKSLHEE